MNSLRGRLLAWLIIPLIVLSATHLVSTYFDTRKTAEAIFDKLLITLALSISEHALASDGDMLTDELLELIRKATNDDIYYKVIGPGHSFIMGYQDIPEPSGGINVLEKQLYYYNTEYYDQNVRVIAISTLVDRAEYNGWMIVFVAQTIRDREEYVESTMATAVWRVIAMILVSGVLLSIGISTALRPLAKLEASVGRRDMRDLSPIEPAHLPSEIRGLVNALNSLLLRLSSNIHLTKRFVENAAHQLRTPVTALLPQAELALRHAKSDRERKAVAGIKRSAEKIARLINQLLNLAYAESLSISGNDSLTIDLMQIADKRAKEISKRNPGVTINSSLQQALIVGEPLLIEEVIDNLLDNAIKYSGCAEIQLNTRQDKDHAILEVSDQGPGIDETDRDKVFERFYRCTTEPPGSGLGLSIIKEIVQAYGGTIEINEGPNGNGVVVRCVFPCAQL